MTRPKFTREQSVQIVNAIRAGIAATKHHKNYSARVQAAIRAEVDKIFPGIVMNFGHHDIAAWHSKFCDFNNRFYAIWNWSSDAHWSEDIEMGALRREDVSDYIERIAQERTLDAAFIALDVEARQLQAKLDTVRAAAIRVVSELPIPKSATLRASANFWNEPTSDTQARYGALFPKV